MSTEAEVQSQEAPVPPDQDPRSQASTGQKIWRAISFKNIGAIWVWVAICVLFSILAPDTFPTIDTVKTVINQNAFPGLLALAILIPLTTQVFDLSLGGGIAFLNVFVAWLMVKQGVAPGLAIALTVLAGLMVGVLNSIVVVGLRVESFIATLATGSLLTAGALMLTEESIIGTPLSTGFFTNMSVNGVAGITYPGLLMFATAFVMWVFLEHTATGRRCFATGFNRDAARLVGIRTRRLQMTGLLVSNFQSGSPTLGPEYLLASITAAFLGSTQFKGGRFNAWGTLVAVLVLGTGSTGLILAGAPTLAPQMFTGSVLIFALALASFERGTAFSWLRLRRTSKPTPTPEPGT
jgi:ribose/xylose/arabinose/galactoside ABC-type transport system permease subunit